MATYVFDWQCGERSRRETLAFDTPEAASDAAKERARAMRQDALAGEEDRTGWHLALRDPDGQEILRLSVDQKEGAAVKGLPGAGPHAQPGLMNEEATPGAGTLAPVGETDDLNIQPTS